MYDATIKYLTELLAAGWRLTVSTIWGEDEIEDADEIADCFDESEYISITLEVDEEKHTVIIEITDDE